MAHKQKTAAGQVVSDPLRDALRPKSVASEDRNGVPLLPRRPNGPRVTAALVNRLRDEDV